ncbi:MAG: DNA polymerase III subunit delta' [Bauldia sp.]|nr:DNA polymerase III subunit delta' [Bauldia sp.]
MADVEIPPIDALPGWPMPEEQGEWYGLREVETLLRDACAGGRLHHAWLIGGLKGVGKATLAFRLARFILARPDPATAAGEGLHVAPDERVFRQIAAGAHPNLLALRRPWDEKTKRYRTALTVDEVRRIQHFFGSTPGEGAWRICIVDNADELNPNAANALLKMLEEPPRRSLFLLVSNTPGMLLPTLRSRCRKLDLPPLSADAIEAALAAREDAPAGERRMAAELSGGSLRRAILMLQGEGVAIYQQFQQLAATLPEVDYEAVHALADAVSGRGNEDAFSGFIDGVQDWLSRRVRREAEPGGVTPSPAVTGAPLASWADVWDKVALSTRDAEELNLDRKQVVLQIFMTLADATRM